MKSSMNLCMTCLSSGRRLTPLQKLKFELREINILEVTHTGSICWECWSIMNKFYKFKKKVYIAQNALKQIHKANSIHSLSDLSIKTNSKYNYEYTCNIEPKREELIIKDEYNDHRNDENITEMTFDNEYQNLDPLVESIGPQKGQLNALKQEPTETTEMTSDHREDLFETAENVFVDVIKTENNKKLKKNICENNEEIKDKFEHIILSEEEMVKLREEKRNHHNFKKIPYKCDSCVLGFKEEENYELHMKKKHDESIGKYICDVCHIRFAKQQHANKHRMKHFVCYKCKICKYETHEIGLALNHCKHKHRADTLDSIHCSQCDAVVKSPEELEAHMRTEHALSCNECGVRFKGNKTLRRHKKRIHAVKREFICDFCSKTFVTKSRLESHMVSHDDVISNKLAYCTLCKVQYKNIYVYRNHLKQSPNHSKRAYSCPECNKSFASKVYRTQHYNFYHLRKSQFKCDVCNKLFISDWRLKNHKQIHHGMSRSRDHPCSVCEKTFYTKATLRTHSLTHSEQRTYMCADCGDTFKQSAALYTHARLVHRLSGK